MPVCQPSKVMALPPSTGVVTDLAEVRSAVSLAPTSTRGSSSARVAPNTARARSMRAAAAASVGLACRAWASSALSWLSPNISHQSRCSSAPGKAALR